MVTRFAGHEPGWVEYERDMRNDPAWLPPTDTIVCPQCRGRGVSTLYLGDVTEMIREDPDFGEDYWGGVYDRECDHCHGRNVIDVIHVEALDSDALNSYTEYMEEAFSTDAIERQERMMGA